MTAHRRINGKILHLLFFLVLTAGCQNIGSSPAEPLWKPFSAIETFLPGTFIFLSGDGYPLACQTRPQLEAYGKVKELAKREGLNGIFHDGGKFQTALKGKIPRSHVQGDYGKIRISDLKIEESHTEYVEFGAAGFGPWLRTLNPTQLHNLSSDILTYCGTAPSLITSVLVVSRGSYTLELKDSVKASGGVELVRPVEASAEIAWETDQKAKVTITTDTYIGYRDTPLPVKILKKVIETGRYEDNIGN